MNKVFGIIGAFGKAVLAIAVMVVAVIAADLVMAAFDRDREVYEGLFSTLYALVMIIIFYLIMTKTTLVNNERKIRRTPLDPLDTVWIFVIALGMLGLTSIYLIITNAIADVNSEVGEAVEEYNEAMERAAAEEEIVLIPNWDHWLYFFTSFLLIPLGEEMMFRGVVLEGFAKYMRRRFAIILSALIFGLLHGISVQIGYAIICGIFLGVVYTVCDSLLASYLMHAVFNFFGAALFTLVDSGAVGTVSESTKNSLFGGAFMLEMGGILCLAPAFYFICARRNILFKPNARIQAYMKTDDQDTEYSYHPDEPEDGDYL